MNQPTFKTTVLGIFLVFGLIACSKTQFAQDAALGGQGPSETANKARPSCEVPEVDYLLNVKVIEFSNTSKTNINFGFSNIPGLEWLRAFDTRFNLKKSTMIVQSEMAEYLKPKNPLAQEPGQFE